MFTKNFCLLKKNEKSNLPKSSVIRIYVEFILRNKRFILFDQSCSISGSVEIFVHWAPENEKSRLVGIGASGFYFGAALAYPICGFAASLFGWEAMFVITGE